MDFVPDDKRIEDQAREALIADMKNRLEQAQTSGQSPEQIQREAAAYAKVEARRQAPQIVAKARSWWFGFRRFLIVGALASGFSIGMALFVEHRYVAPLCEQYGTQHGLLYRGIYYPVMGSSSTTSSSGRCIFVDSAERRKTFPLAKLVPNAAIALLVSFALDIEATIPISFILIALIAVAIGRLRQ